MQTETPHASRFRTLSRPTLRLALCAVALVALGACGGLLGGGEPSPLPPADRTVSGEVERVEAYDNEIDLWTEDRRIVTFHYDERTAVYYRGERYAPTALEAGDLVSVQMERVANGDWIATRIDVTAGRQDRADGGGGSPGERYPDERYDPDGETTTLSGEVERVDTRDREIEIDADGERVTFGYRTGTVVYYRGERYEVANLEPGDLVRTRVERDRRGVWVTDAITVEQSRQEREDERYGDDRYDDERYDDRPGEAVRYAGTVQEIDRRRGEFVLRTERYGLRTIVMPYDASRADREAFERLRRGDRVEIEVDPQRDGRADLLRFGWRPHTRP